MKKQEIIPVMAHVIADYPSHEIALTAVQALVEAHVTYIEVQLPFSDPSADGQSIQTACAEVLSRSYSVDEAFSFIQDIHSLYPQIPLFLMTYGNLVFNRGCESFVSQAAEVGVTHLIVPDFPFDADEGLHTACVTRGLSSVPVIAPSMSASRLTKVRALQRPYMYAALRAGITGTKTHIDEHTISYLTSINSETNILGGFGIRSGEQSKALSPYVHAVVAGSVFVDTIRENAQYGKERVHSAVYKKAQELVCGISV